MVGTCYPIRESLSLMVALAGGRRRRMRANACLMNYGCDAKRVAADKINMVHGASMSAAAAAKLMQPILPVLPTAVRFYAACRHISDRNKPLPVAHRNENEAIVAVLDRADWYGS